MKKFLIVLLSVTLYACGTGKDASVIPPQEFKTKIAAADIQILDVRTPEEFKEGHIANAVNIDINGPDFESASNALYKDLPVYVYCKAGVRSHKAALKLRELGFKDVYELKGGFDAWKDGGLPQAVAEVPKVYPNDTIPFEKAIEGNKLVLVDFNATWCKPCRILEPVIQKIHDTRSDEVIVYSIDVDEHRDLAMKYQAERIPLILMFKNGKIVHRSEGVVEDYILNQVIDKNL